MPEEKVNYARKALRGAGIIFIFSIFSALFGYLTRLVIAKNLSVEDYGLFYAVLSVILLIVLFERFGLDEALIKFIAEYKAKEKNSLIKSSIISVFIINFLMALAIALILVLFSDFFALNYFHDARASSLIKIFAIFLIFRPVVASIKGIFRGFKKMVHYSLVDISRDVLIFLICLIGFNFSKSVLIPSIAYVAESIILIAIFMPFVFRIFPQFSSEKFKFSKRIVKKLFWFGTPLILASACIFILEYIDTLMLTYFSGLREVGLYNVAHPTAKLLSYFGIAVAVVVFPFTSELWAKKDNKRLKQGINLIYKYSFLAILPFALIMFAFPELILKLFFGSKYIEAALPLRILSIGVLFLAMANINGQIISGIGKPQLFAKAIFFASVFNIILNALLIPAYGTAGAATATSISYFLMFSLTSYKLKSLVKNKIPVAAWLTNFIIAFVFVGLVCLLKQILNMGVWPEAIIITAISLSVYIILVLLLKLTTIQEVKSLIKRVI